MKIKNAITAFMNGFIGGKDEDIFHLLEEITCLVKKDKREMLFFEGDDGESIYFLISGSIKLFKTNEEGKEAVIRFVEPGDIFAEILLYTKNRYPVNAMAIQPSELLAINARKLFDLIKERPELAMKLIEQLALRTKYLVKMIETLTLSDVRDRFLNYLQFLENRTGNKTITLPVPKGELALLLGTVPETFSRLLKRLSEEGVIEVRGRKISLLKR
ncbi:MAG: Crp/Fnr family transcriptional regulator [Thermodesulfobacteriota bacterium]